MLNLPTTASVIQVITGSAVDAIEVHASWIDLSLTTTDIDPGDLDSTILGAATTVVVPSPPSGFVRNVKYLSISNQSVSSCQVTIQHSDGTTLVDIFDIDLPSFYSIQYSTDGVGFVVYDDGGCILMVECP